MDDLNQQLIALLRQNARMNVADLAHRLKVSRGTAWVVYARMELRDVIASSTADRLIARPPE